MLPGYLPVGNICGRAFNNATVGATAFRALGLNTFDASRSELYGVDSNSIGEWTLTYIPFGLTDRLAVLRNTLKIMSKVKGTLKTLDAQLSENPTWCETERKRLIALNQSELLEWAEKLFFPKMLEAFWWMTSPAMSQADVVSKLHRLGLRYLQWLLPWSLTSAVRSATARLLPASTAFPL